MDAKEYLEGYANYARVERQCREEYKAEKEALREIVQFHKRSATGEWKRENANSIQACISHCNKLPERAERCREQMDAILDTINSIPGLEREILYLRYIDGLIWEDVCERVCYSWNGAFKIHEKALRMVQDIIDRREAGADQCQEQ